MLSRTLTDIALHPVFERFYVQAFALRADQLKICAPGHPVWRIPLDAHDGAYLPWGATVIGQRVVDERLQGEEQWVCLRYHSTDAETKLWVAMRVRTDEIDDGPEWRDVLVPAGHGPVWSQPDQGIQAYPEDVVRTTGTSWFDAAYAPWERLLPAGAEHDAIDGPLPPRWVCGSCNAQVGVPVLR